MDAPSWWNNKFWRPANTAFTGDTHLQKPVTPTNSGPPLSATFGGQNRRIIRPTFRSDLYRRDSARPLGSLRVTHGRRTSMDTSKILQRPSSASRTSMPGPGRTSLTNSLTTDEVRNSTVPMNAFNYILKNSSNNSNVSKSSSGGGEVHVNVNLEEVMTGKIVNDQIEDSEKPFPTFEQFQQQQISQKQKILVQQQQQRQLKSQIMNYDNQTNAKHNDWSQNGGLDRSGMNNASQVISSQYGRKIVRPYSSGIITRVGEIKLVDLEETLNIQPHQITSKHQQVSESQQIRPPVVTTKDGIPKLQTTFPNYKPVFYNSNLMGNFGGNDTSVNPTEIISKPPKIPLKSILKKNDCLPSQIQLENGSTPSDVNQQHDNINSLPAQDGNTNESEDAKATANISVNEQASDQKSTHDNSLPPKSPLVSQTPERPILKSSKTIVFNDQEKQRKRILLRRNMRSAPSLKREVRFDMRSTDVVEFYPTDTIRDIRLIK